MATSSDPGPTVQTAAGPLIGAARSDGVAAFLGVPYAAPPVGALRFRHPEPVAPWTGVRPAFEPGPAAPQPGDDPQSSIVPGMIATDTDENCLGLNVWAPAGTEPGADLPVMVWVHGGGFMIGGSTLPTYDPTLLVREEDVVVVAPNYRLGALGFLAPEARSPAARGDQAIAPNCGLADLVLALHWVQTNIGAFGGDPGRVTMFGESAGAGAILHLMSAPAAAGLFHRAILQSPGVGQTLDREKAAQVATELMSRLGIDPQSEDAAARLRGTGVGALIDAQEATTAALAASVGALPFHPVVDGELVPEAPLAALGAGRGSGVETIVGTTEDEMRLFMSAGLAGLSRDHLVAILAPVIARAVGGRVDHGAVGELVANYDDRFGADGAGAELWAAVMTDGLMRLPAEAALEAHAAWQDNVYSYSFEWKPGGSVVERGSFHAIDLPFTFGTFDREGWAEILGAGDGAREVSRVMRAAWAAFARDGEPGTAVPGGWPRWDPQRRATLVLDDPPSVADDPLAPRRKAWEALRHG